MKIVIKLALVPIWIIVAMCWLLAAMVSRIYALTHGFLWIILLIPIAIACLLQMWQNALIFFAVGIISYMVLFGLTAVEVALETIRVSLGAVIRI